MDPLSYYFWNGALLVVFGVADYVLAIYLIVLLQEHCYPARTEVVMIALAGVGVLGMYVFGQSGLSLLALAAFCLCALLAILCPHLSKFKTHLARWQMKL
jgi:hypothetical protein